mmetsp:Transcript_90605/g.242676  ORF Transcript_90605/g.242676 Transcript_90605/m.242676 type:complete len:179 (-) Transcript_90605:8-544(-)
MVVSWMPEQLRARYDLPLGIVGLVSGLPSASQVVVSCLAGYVADRCIPEYGVARVRSFAQTLSMMGMGTGMVLFAVAGSELWLGMTWMCLALAFASISVAGVSVFHFHLAPSRAGFLFGCGNTVGTLAGMVSVPLTGLLVERAEDPSNPWVPYMLCAVICFVAGLLWVCVARRARSLE